MLTTVSQRHRKLFETIHSSHTTESLLRPGTVQATEVAGILSYPLWRIHCVPDLILILTTTL